MSVHLVKLNYKINEELHSRAPNVPSTGSCRLWNFVDIAPWALND